MVGQPISRLERHCTGARHARRVSPGRTQGFTIKDDHRVPDGRGDITVLNPGDGFTFSVSSGEPPALALIINSPCYRTDKPLP
jgi:hypothetical protein